MTGLASTRAAASASAIFSLPTGLADEPMIASAWSKLIMPPLFPRRRLTSTTPKRAAAAAARTSRLLPPAYSWARQNGEWDWLVPWSNRTDGGSDRGAAQGAGQTEGPRGPR